MTVRNYIKKRRGRKEKSRGDRAGRFCEFLVEINSTSLITVSGIRPVYFVRDAPGLYQMGYPPSPLDLWNHRVRQEILRKIRMAKNLDTKIH
jgi:hypothetical protein